MTNQTISIKDNELSSLPDVKCIMGDFIEQLARTREMIGLANRKKTELEILARVYENAVRELQQIPANEYEENEPPFEPDARMETTPLPEDIPGNIEDLPEELQDIPTAETEPVSPEENPWPDFPDIDEWK